MLGTMIFSEEMLGSTEKSTHQMRNLREREVVSKLL